MGLTQKEVRPGSEVPRLGTRPAQVGCSPDPHPPRRHCPRQACSHALPRSQSAPNREMVPLLLLWRSRRPQTEPCSGSRSQMAGGTRVGCGRRCLAPSPWTAKPKQETPACSSPRKQPSSLRVPRLPLGPRETGSRGGLAHTTLSFKVSTGDLYSLWLVRRDIMAASLVCLG